MEKLELLAEIQTNIENHPHDKKLVADVIKILKRGESDKTISSGFFKTRTKTIISECLDILDKIETKPEPEIGLNIKGANK